MKNPDRERRQKSEWLLKLWNYESEMPVLHSPRSTFEITQQDTGQSIEHKPLPTRLD